MAESQEENATPEFQPKPIGSFFDSPSPSSEEAPKKDPPVEVEEKPEVTASEDAVKEEAGAAVEEEEQPSGLDWDSDDNPHLKKAREWQGKYDQTLAQAQKMQRQIDRLQQQVEGTYDPDQEQEKEQERLQAELSARAETSKMVALERYGDDRVRETVEWFDSTYANDVGMQNRILYSQAPFLEAIKLKEEQDFFGKYGRPDKAIENIRKEILEQERETLKKEVREELLKKGKNAREAAPSISDVQGSSEPQKKVNPGHKPLGKIFGG